MTITRPRPSSGAGDDIQVLFKEARQRRRRRYWYSGVVLLLIGCVGLALNQWLSATPKTLMKPPTKVAAERPAAKPSSATVVPRQPGPLALGANGELYVADDALNDILARLPDGRFKVVAGTASPGIPATADRPQRQSWTGPLVWPWRLTAPSTSPTRGTVG